MAMIAPSNGKVNAGNRRKKNLRVKTWNTGGATITKKMAQPCTLVLRETQFDDQTDDHAWECELDPVDNDSKSSGFMKIDTALTKDEHDFAEASLESGSTMMKAEILMSESGSYISGKPQFQEKTKAHRVRLQEKTSGTRSVLVIRAEAGDAKTTPSENDLALMIFGRGGDNNFNLSSGYNECSYGQLKFEPISTLTNTAVSDGVHTVTITESVADSNSDIIRDAMIAKAKSNLGVTDLRRVADHIMLCIPPGTSSGSSWIAYSYVNSWLSVYNDSWCTKVSAQMHEIGHNIGLGHSNENGNSYQDQSGMMGFSYYLDESPRMCFNSAKFYQLGWFQDAETNVRPLVQEGWTGSLIGFTDYQNEDINEVDTIVLTIEGHSLDFHVGFNRLTGLNAGNMEGAANKVLVQSRPPGRSYAASQLVAKLDVGESYKIENFGNSSQPAVIKVSSIDQNGATHKATVSIYLEKCTSNSDCDDGNTCSIDTCNISTGTCSNTHSADNCAPELQVTVHTDNYPAETSWVLVDLCNDNAEILSESTDSYLSSNETYEKTINIPPSMYSFTIKDSFGDGNCCDFGLGSYTVQYNNEIVAHSNEFTISSETKIWGSCDVSKKITSIPSNTISAIPSQSPTKISADISVSIVTDAYPGETTFKVVDICNDETVVMSGGPFPFSNHLFTDITSASLSRYRFIIEDKWGDGMCCSYGDGSWEVSYANEIVGSGKQFGSSDSAEFGELTCPKLSSVSPSRAPANPVSPSTVPSLEPTISLSNKPSITPTLSPTSCDLHYSVKVNTGSVGQVVSWIITEDQDHEFIAAMGAKEYGYWESHDESGCLQNDCYRFKIMDSSGAGIKDGFYSLEINDRELVNGGVFLYEQTTLFGTCRQASQ